MIELDLDRVSKRYNDFVAVKDLSLKIGAGELVCLLGPSGCGKSTTLRMIAGFESVDGGAMRLDGHDIAAIPAHKRGIGVVFQSYALFPHKTVAENIGFGLKMRGCPKSEIAAAVARGLSLVRLQNLGDRKPSELSGGQQQRVALARALAFEPKLLLMDEPLSNLDAQLREEMRDEIKRVQREVGTTTVFVTHDQAEALAMADRIAVMQAGHLLQYGTPSEIYEAPAGRDVGAFIGKANLFEGRITARVALGAEVTLTDGFTLQVPAIDAPLGATALVMVRPERMRLGEAATLAEHRLQVVIEACVYLGESYEYLCRAGAHRLRVLVPNTARLPALIQGDTTFVGWDSADSVLFRA